MDSISIEIDSAVIREIEARIARFHNRKPLFDRIGGALVADAQMNFRQSRGPDGTPWAPLKIRKGRPLLDTGRLRSSISYDAGDDQVAVGTNVKYAAVHQFGATIRPRSKKLLRFQGPNGFIFAKAVTIPARPFLGIADRQVATINRIIDQWSQEVAHAG